MKEITLPYITFICLMVVCLIVGILISGMYSMVQYREVVVLMSDKYMDSIVQVSGMDFKDILESYEWCEVMMNESSLVENIRFHKSMGNLT